MQGNTFGVNQITDVLKMINPFVATNPQNFRLYIYWFFEGSDKMVTEFPDSKWLPGINETLVLPIIDEASELKHCRRWHKFKVVDIIYDFKKQNVRVWCKPLPLDTVTQKAVLQKAEIVLDRELEFFRKEIDAC